jgi:hypothetical protein
VQRCGPRSPQVTSATASLAALAQERAALASQCGSLREQADATAAEHAAALQAAARARASMLDLEGQRAAAAKLLEQVGAAPSSRHPLYKACTVHFSWACNVACMPSRLLGIATASSECAQHLPRPAPCVCPLFAPVSVMPPVREKHEFQTWIPRRRTRSWLTSGRPGCWNRQTWPPNNVHVLHLRGDQDRATQPLLPRQDACCQAGGTTLRRACSLTSTAHVRPATPARRRMSALPGS